MSPPELPRLLVLTDRTQCDRPLPEVVAAAVDAGARAVVLRDKDLPAAERAALAADLRRLLAPVDGLLVHGGPAGSEGSHAVHLSSADPFPAPRPALVGRSCHSAAELARARAEGCDWAMLSPVFPTASKPGYGPTLGVEGFARAVAAGPRVYALGGVAPSDVGDLVAAGAYGVAVMGAVMRNPEVVADHLAALRAALEPTRPDPASGDGRPATGHRPPATGVGDGVATVPRVTPSPCDAGLTEV